MTDLFDKRSLEQRAIDLLQAYQPKNKPYYGCFSGGKDSCVIKELAKRAGVNVVWHYNVTTIDPPELTRFIKRFHPDVVLEKPEKNFFEFAVGNGFPTRRSRWCCEEFKESRSPIGSVLIFGVRWAESARRKTAWKEVTMHNKTKQFVVSPIIAWSDLDVWNYMRSNNLPYCNLYDEGFKRLGCIGCPMARRDGKLRQFERWPHMERRWKKLFQDVWNRRTGSLQRDGRMWFGDRYFSSWEEMWNWWLNDEPLPGKQEECQGILDFYA